MRWIRWVFDRVGIDVWIRLLVWRWNLSGRDDVRGDNGQIKISLQHDELPSTEAPVKLKRRLNFFRAEEAYELLSVGFLFSRSTGSRPSYLPESGGRPSLRYVSSRSDAPVSSFICLNG
jgi:hypothetical protein